MVPNDQPGNRRGSGVPLYTTCVVRGVVGAILDIMVILYERSSLSAAATVMRRHQDLQPLAST